MVIPIGFGIYLAWYFWSNMPQKDKDQVWSLFSRFNYLFIVLSLLACWISHYSRALRWSYMLEALGYKTNKWNNYHAVITGYFMNMLLPRAGEISRAGVISRYEGIPFEKAFGTIMAERVIDMIIFLTSAIVTLSLQGEKYPLMVAKYNELKSAYSSGKSSVGTYILVGIIVIGLIGAFLYFKNLKFKTKVNSILRGFADGLLTIIRLKKRWQFFGHTFLIWGMYLTLYWVVFLGIPETSGISPNGMLLGFLAGGLAIILVPGGIGIYPVFVAAALSFYCSDYPALYGLGWLAWISQTILIVGAGMISLYLVPKLNRKTS
jgi:uncharacterized protein (TIRG00374 family)